MSVLIKGMDMPTSEEKCKFFQPAPFRAPFCVINRVCHGIDNCPLVEVPPHGRLIDADALEKCGEIVKQDQGYYYVKGIALTSIYNAPTIIEEER